jgi:hypothetical protein
LCYVRHLEFEVDWISMGTRMVQIVWQKTRRCLDRRCLRGFDTLKIAIRIILYYLEIII